MDLVQATTELFSSPARSFPVRLWDGTRLPPARDGTRLPPARDERLTGCVVLAHPRVLDGLLPPVSERRLAEAYLEGDLELEGDIAGLLEAAARWEGPQLRPSLAPAILSIVARRGLTREGASALAERLTGRLHSVARDRDAVRHHYDLSDAFYRLFLDRALVYSCAYFERGTESLEEAQQAKLELCCRKLALREGERLLDVGCGWGALLAWAAERHQVDGLGITLSEHQLEEARRRLARIPGREVKALALDYRRLVPDDRFHKAVSVGMMEHVGRENLDEYFSSVHRLLLPGGLFLNHAIADLTPGASTLPWASRGDGGFIQHDIFPDSDLVPLDLVIAAAGRAGFEVRDVESLREHYAETLAIWLARLEGRMGEAVSLVGGRVARAYRLYLASSIASFRLGRISVFQLLLAKPDAAGRARGVPRCRDDWCQRPLSAALPAAAAVAPAAGS